MSLQLARVPIRTEPAATADGWKPSTIFHAEMKPPNLLQQGQSRPQMGLAGNGNQTRRGLIWGPLL